MQGPELSPVSTATGARRRNDWKVTYDPALETGSSKKAKETVTRRNGEGVLTSTLRDPRLSHSHSHSHDKQRKSHRNVINLSLWSFQYDANSVGPPPPAPACGIFVSKISPLTPPHEVLKHFTQFGRIVEQEFKLDPKSGASIGMAWIKYHDDSYLDASTGDRKVDARGQVGHSCALEAIKQTHGFKIGKALAMGGKAGIVSVELDADGSKTKAAFEAEVKRKYASKPVSASTHKQTTSSAPRPNEAHLRTDPLHSRTQTYSRPSNSASPTQSPNPQSQSNSTDTSRHRSTKESPASHVELPRREGSAAVFPPPTSAPSAREQTSTLLQQPHSARSAELHEASTSKPQTAERKMSSPILSSDAAQPFDDNHLASKSTQHQSPTSPWGRKPTSTSPKSPWLNLHGSPQSAAKVKTFQPQLKVQAHQNVRNGDDMEIDSSTDSGPQSGEDDQDNESRVRKRDRDKVFFPRTDHTSPRAHTTSLHGRTTDSISLLNGAAVGLGLSTTQVKTSEEIDDLARLNAQRQLAFNRMEHAKIAKSAIPVSLTMKPVMATERELRKHFATFRPREIFTDPENWYITFYAADSAQKSQVVLDQQIFHSQPLAFSIHPAPLMPGERHVVAAPKSPSVSIPLQTNPNLISPEELISRAKHLIFKDLCSTFERDLRARIVEPKIKELLSKRAEVTSRLQQANPAAYGSLLPFASSSAVTATPAQATENRVESEHSSPELLQEESHAALSQNQSPEIGAGANKSAPEHAKETVLQKGVVKLPTFTKRQVQESTQVANSKSQRNAQYSGWSHTRSPDGRETESLMSEPIRDDISDSSSLRHNKKYVSRKLPAEVGIDRNLVETSAITPKHGRKIVDFTSDEEEEEGQITSLPTEKTRTQPTLIVRPAEKKTKTPSARKEVTYTSSEGEEVPAIDEATPDADTPLDVFSEEEDIKMVIERPTIKRGAKRKRANKKASQPRAASSKPKIEEREPTLPDRLPLIALEPEPVIKVKPKRQIVMSGEPVDPFEAHVATDEEDLYYLKVIIERWADGKPLHPEPMLEMDEEEAAHQTGAARTEGYYKIAAAQKSSYLPSRNRAMVDPSLLPTSISASRNARVTTRRLVGGLEQQRRGAAAESNASDAVKFNQLRARKKQLKFARSPIHDWGLYSMEFIPAGDMIVEYVGELIRQQIADRRERNYEKMGIGSSYLFRIDDDFVVDATKKGSMSRLINHSCEPNCIAKIINLSGGKKIVIYARIPIEAGEELTYDYKFASEADEFKIPCLCGAPGCRKYLN